MSCGIILAHARSGSSEIARALRVAGARVALEPFHRVMKEQGITHESDKFPDYKNAVLSNYDAIKLMWNGATASLVSDVLRDKRARPILLLERQDIFATAVSGTVARMTKNFRRSRPKRLNKNIPIEELRNRIDRLSRGQAYWRGWLDGSGLPYMAITYESFYSSETIEEAAAKFADLCDLFNVRKDNVEAAASLIMPERKYSDFSFYKTAPNWAKIESIFQPPDTVGQTRSL